MTKQEILNRLKCLSKDFQMLQDGTWIPDTDSTQCSIDSVEEIITFLESNNLKEIVLIGDIGAGLHALKNIPEKKRGFTIIADHKDEDYLANPLFDVKNETPTFIEEEKHPFNKFMKSDKKRNKHKK